MAQMLVHSAHPAGVDTCLAFSQDGSKIYTGGQEGYVRIWRTDLGEEQEPAVAHEAEDAITSLATSQQCWLSASHDACVRTYDAQGRTMQGLITRAIAVSIRCIAIDAKGERVAVTSDELEVKVIHLNDITKIQKMEGHRKGVRRVTWHPSGTLLTTCGYDGDIIVWDVTPGQEPKQMETISGIIPAVDSQSPDAMYDCSAVWHPSGNYFVVAGRAHEIVTISREDWKRTIPFSDNEMTGAITALGLSPNGMYLASALLTSIFVWSTTSRSIILRHDFSSNPPPVLQLAFSPTQNLLAWTDAEGALTRWSEPIPSKLPNPAILHPAPKKTTNPLLFDDEGHEETKDGAGDDDYGLDDDWIIDDIGLLDKTEKDKDRLQKSFAREMVSVTKAQPAFQPASTPMINRKRYLAFNMIGAIEVTDQDTHHIVNVEFHDRSTRVGSHFQDTSKFNLASLGERGALYACQPEDDHPSQVVYKPYSSWASSGDWQYALPPGETVVALAAGGTPPSKSLRHAGSDGDLEGNGNVVVATSKSCLRFLTGGGVQRYLWALGADVVSMVAGHEWVFVVHRDGGTSLDGCQNLAYTLVTLDTFDVVQQGRLPLPRGCVLKWIGISNEGAPAMYDSDGLLSILDRFRRPGQARWIPILDITTLARRKGKDESYWPVGVSGTHFMCVILKGREEHAGFPRPLIQEIEVQMPLFNLDAPQGQLEERFLRETLQIGILRDALGFDLTSSEISRREINLDKELIQLIQVASKSNQLQRALDTAALLHHTASFDKAIKLAQFYHMVGLEEKLTTLKTERLETDRLQEEKEARRNWGKQSAPIAAPQSNTQTSVHRRQFEEFAPPSATVRKSLAPAIPVTSTGNASGGTVGPSMGFRSNDLVSASRPQLSEFSPWEDSLDADAFGSTEKRKREDSAPAVDDPFEAGSSKKRALVDASEPNASKSTKTSANPFARKPQDPKNNPFSRPAGVKAKIATKSNSFFDKVEQANEIATRTKTNFTKETGKEKEKRDASRQTTLFGLPPGPGAEKKGRGRPPKDKDTGAEDIPSTQSSLPESTKKSSTTPRDPLPNLAETQATDITMADAPSLNDQREVDQPFQDDKEFNQVPDSQEPEIEWPPSPRSTSVSEVIVN